jgi:protein SCO1/2
MTARGLDSRMVRQPAAAACRPLAIAAGLLLIAVAAFSESSATAPKLPGKVGIEQRLDKQLPLDVPFRDENGRPVLLRDSFHGRPVILNFVYFNCPMLCSIVVDGMTSSLTELKFSIGKEFDVVTISIDPHDTPRAAWAKRDKYIRRYGRPTAYESWRFLTGTEAAIRKVADAAGFFYAYDKSLNQYAHGTALIVLTPQGRISRYLYGFEYRPRDVRLALVEASAGKIGTATDAVLLLCYHYDPATGKYSRTAMNFVRAGGIATIFGLVGFIGIMLQREHKRAVVTPTLSGREGEAPGGTGGAPADPTSPPADARGERRRRS